MIINNYKFKSKTTLSNVFLVLVLIVIVFVDLRSRPYSFGLGKRSVEDDQSNEEFPMDIDQPTLTDIFEQYDEMPGN